MPKITRDPQTQYPLIYPRGVQQWGRGLKKSFYVIGFFGVIGLLVFLAGCMHRTPELDNVLRLRFAVKVKGLDPARTHGLYSHIVLSQICETLFQYAYLKRPYQLEPLIAAGAADVSEDLLTYTIYLKKKVRFADDPCFKKTNGQGRELTAHDFVFAIKRVADLHVRSTGWWVYDQKIKGLNAFREYTGTVDKDAVDYKKMVEGLRALDNYTLQFILTKPCPFFEQLLAHSYAMPMAREAVAYYGAEIINHPVGTGPFYLADWRRGQKMVLEKNKNFREVLYPSEGMPGDSAAGLLVDAGKPLPLIDRIEYQIITESQPFWLNFTRGYLDMGGIPKDNFNQAISQNFELTGSLRKKRIKLTKGNELEFVYFVFNFQNEFLKKNKKVREAMRLAYDKGKIIELFYNGRATPTWGPIPPGLTGYDSTLRNSNQTFNPERAKQVLKEAGFPGGKGIPNLNYIYNESTVGRQWAEQVSRMMAKIGITIKKEGMTWPEFLKRQKKGQFDVCGGAWIADYPDAENFHQLFYGPNKPPGPNTGSYQNPEFDSLYRIIAQIPFSPERTQYIRQMTKVLQDDCAAIFLCNRQAYALRYDWIQNYKFCDGSLISNKYKYYRIDIAARNRWIKAGLGRVL